MWFRDRSYGWSEHYLYIPGDPLSAVLAQLQQLAVARVGLHNGAVQLYRLSAADAAGAGNRYSWDPRVGSTRFGLPPIVCPNLFPLPDNPYSAVLITLSTSGPNGRIFMSGLPDDYIFDQSFEPNNAWQAAFKAFNGILTQTAVVGKLAPPPVWGIRGRDKLPMDNPTQNITFVSLTPPVAFTTGAAGNWVPGDKVQVANAVWLPAGVRANKIYRVVSVVANVTEVLGFPSAITQWVGLGTLQRISRTTFLITAADYDVPARHKRGVGYEPARGKARPVK